MKSCVPPETFKQKEIYMLQEDKLWQNSKKNKYKGA